MSKLSKCSKSCPGINRRGNNENIHVLCCVEMVEDNVRISKSLSTSTSWINRRRYYKNVHELFVAERAGQHVKISDGTSHNIFYKILRSSSPVLSWRNSRFDSRYPLLRFTLGFLEKDHILCAAQIRPLLKNILSKPSYFILRRVHEFFIKIFTFCSGYPPL